MTPDRSLQDPRKRLLKWLKKRARPALNRYLARHSLVGDPARFATGVFPWVAELEKNWEPIRDEARRILALREHIPAFQEISPDQYRISNTDEWKTFWYRGFGHRSQVFAELCPETARQVDAIPDVETAFFSILAPGKHIPAHRGVYKGIINCHLGLLIPKERERCRIRVGRKTFSWAGGECRIFDDTRKHEVWNETDEERVVLMIQFQRPLRSPGKQVSRLFLAALARTPYVTVSKRNHIAFEKRLEAVFEARG
jgi:aspartyl/asparaginyl beta-hydroxylase (cupin superfamily)